MKKFFKKLLRAIQSLTHYSRAEEVDTKALPLEPRRSASHPLAGLSTTPSKEADRKGPGQRKPRGDKNPDDPQERRPAPLTSPIDKRAPNTSPVRRRLLFLLLGSTGAGKTTFIDLALSKQDAGTDARMDQVMKGIEYQQVRHPGDPEVELILVDTPGLGERATPNDIRKALARFLASPEAATFSNAEFSAILWIEQIGGSRQPGLHRINPLLDSCLKDPDLRDRVVVLTTSEVPPEDRLQIHRQQLSEKLVAARTDSEPTTVQHVDMTSDSVWKVLNSVMENSRDEMSLGALRRCMEKK